MISEVITIMNDTGLHARPAAVFVSTAAKFKSEIMLQKGEKQVNAKSILAVLSLGISKGTDIIISAQGPDEEEAVGALVELTRSNFNE
ncbi:HPr family phosphocarrier protein [Sinanaerobacter chloroacetimidivorans]|jgi:phosphocarrier protein HPr|uniref:Phosphocarrier protein HPr n=1 Tax=Sinanaerobacter chloroacetimidivorans TaxID=2818044 RepID=A0A8J7VWU3_9FIRM|nr:HPr family phosphocarrier protein [Sinanaerobacter chloroacetimidivorans]MBR0596487.1 HPr family phosphocarrier protein [Sinanaerobacter chloroacetimidivorans]